MKKLIMLIMALALVCSSLPKAEAAETAALGLNVTFEIPKAVITVTNMGNPVSGVNVWVFQEGSGYQTNYHTTDANGQVIWEDLPADGRYWFNAEYDHQGFALGYPDYLTLPIDATIEIPGPATPVTLIGITLPLPDLPFPEITVYRADGQPIVMNGVSYPNGIMKEAASNITNFYIPTGIEYKFKVVYNDRELWSEVTTAPNGVTIDLTEPVISIELSQTSWQLDGVRLGERRTNIGSDGVPIHIIRNTGNVPVLVDIGYASLITIPEAPQPGLEQGFNTFITMVGELVLPPDKKLGMSHAIDPGMEEPLPLTYGAPTALSGEVGGMGATYEIRAYGVPPPGPDPEPLI